MNRDAKRINPDFSGDISRVKGFMLNNCGQGFYGNNYVFKTAIRELRKEGIKIKFDRKQQLYFKEV